MWCVHPYYLPRPKTDKSVVEVMPGSGLEIYAHPGRSALYVRRYDPVTQRYIRRSTGQTDIESAKGWVLANLQVLFAAEVDKRSGGNYSITRQIAAHLDYLEQRHKAGEIAASTLIAYQKNGRHWIKWFSINNMKKVSDIKYDSLKNYGLNRINDDGFSPNTVNLEIIYIRMWFTWLLDENLITRAPKVNSVSKAVENRTGGEPFAKGDLKTLHSTIGQWVDDAKSPENFGKRDVSEYNKKLFRLFIALLQESGCRQHEIWSRTWKDIKIGKTNTNRKQTINMVAIPMRAKRGARQTVFRGEALLLIRELQNKMCPDTDKNDLIFRNQQTNTLIDASTFSRYWNLIKDKCGLDYPLHTFRSHRITQLIMSGVSPQLVARNLGLSVSQIEKTYLRFTPAGHFRELIQKDLPQDNELLMLM